MNCVACKDGLVEYVEGLLAEADRAAMHAHLQECPACRTEIEQLALAHARLLSDGRAGPPVALAGPVMDRILRNQTLQPRETLWRRIMAHRIAASGVAAAVCVVAASIALSFAYRPGGKHGNAVRQESANPPAVSPVPSTAGEIVAIAPGSNDDPRPYVPRPDAPHPFATDPGGTHPEAPEPTQTGPMPGGNKEPMPATQAADTLRSSPAALEKKLHGSWRDDHPCPGGKLILNADGTYERLRYGPGGYHLTGTWHVRWDAQPANTRADLQDLQRPGSRQHPPAVQSAVEAGSTG